VVGWIGGRVRRKVGSQPVTDSQAFSSVLDITLIRDNVGEVHSLLGFPTTESVILHPLIK
jgi:hypothetical protein